MIYKYEIKEILSRYVIVKANSEEEADKFIDYKYYDEGTIVLDAEDFHGDSEIDRICLGDDVDEIIDYDLTAHKFKIELKIKSIVFESLQDMEEFQDTYCYRTIMSQFRRKYNKIDDIYTLVWMSEADEDIYKSVLNITKKFLETLEEHNASYVFSFGKDGGQLTTISYVS